MEGIPQPPTRHELQERFANLKGRGISISDAPMVYHLWAAVEKVDHMGADEFFKRWVIKHTLDLIDYATRDR